MSDDLISRQAAIDAMNELPYGYRGIVWNIIDGLPSTKQPRTCEFWDGESNYCALHRPSAEPEITRCHECAKRRTLDCPMGITVFDAPPSDGYCYKAERRI